MKKIFITYGDERFRSARARIVKYAQSTNEFDAVISWGKADISRELKDSKIISVERGGGLWSWKPDIILKTMELYNDGDFIVYCDSGCVLQSSKEWNWYWKKLQRKDIIAQLIYTRTDKWSRKELLDYFIENGDYWQMCYMFLATTVILVINDFTRMLVQKWRDLMIFHSELAMDVKVNERINQHKSFIENRHDQAVFSALIYNTLFCSNYSNRVCVIWERIEDLHPFRKQAIRAARLRMGEEESQITRIRMMIKRLVKEYLLYPSFYIPKQVLFYRLNKLSQKNAKKNNKGIGN